MSLALIFQLKPEIHLGVGGERLSYSFLMDIPEYYNNDKYNYNI